MLALRQMLSEMRRATAWATLLSGCLCLLTLAGARLVAVGLDPAFGLSSRNTLLSLVLVGAGLIAAGVVLSLSRDTVLARSGLWLNHEFGQLIRSPDLKPGFGSRDRERLSASLNTLARFLAGPRAGRALDAVWVPAYLIALYLAVPMLAGVAVVSALGLAGTGFWLLKGTPRARDEDAGVAPAAALSHHASVADWEYANRFFVAQTYLRSTRASRARALMQGLRCGALLAAVGIFAVFAPQGGGAMGVFIAAVILLERTHTALAGAAMAAPAIRDGLHAFKDLRARMRPLSQPVGRSFKSPDPAARKKGTDPRPPAPFKLSERGLTAPTHTLH